MTAFPLTCWCAVRINQSVSLKAFNHLLCWWYWYSIDENPFLKLPCLKKEKQLQSYWLVSLFNGISTFVGYLMPKIFSKKWYYLTHSWEDKRVHTFPKGICPKVNIIAWLEYELAYYDSTVHRFNHYTTIVFLLIFSIFLMFTSLLSSVLSFFVKTMKN